MQPKKARSHLVAEPAKREGVRYALTEQGVELAIIDTTQPAFLVSMSEEEQRVLEARFVQQQAAFAKIPSWLRTFLLSLYLRGSLLASGIRESRGTYLSGIGTYLLKLGADNLPSVLATRADEEIAASLPAIAVRVRLQDMVQLTADSVIEALDGVQQCEPLFMLNIAGGTAIDSLNTLILLKRDCPSLLAERRIVIHVLDRETEAAFFGKSALEALTAPGGPLHGIEISFRERAYDWAHAADLKCALDEANSEHAVVVATSEGGLFEYGSDADIVANLRYLRTHARGLEAVIGSVTRADPLTRSLHRTSGAKVHCRGLESFTTLATNAGYRIRRAIERPLSDLVILVPHADVEDESCQIQE